MVILTFVAERDSVKDEAVVFIFVFTTVALLTWAAVRPWVNRWMEVSQVYSITPGYVIGLDWPMRFATRDYKLTLA